MKSKRLVSDAESLFSTERKIAFMKRCCKKVDIFSNDFIEFATIRALKGKLGRSDVVNWLYEVADGMSKKDLREIVANPNEKHKIMSLIRKHAEIIRSEIKDRRLTTEPIVYRMKYDQNCGKWRELGVESPKQLVLDEVFNTGCAELWRKIGYHQYASLVDKGAIKGKKAIENRLRRKVKKSVYAWKGDVYHCYPSINKDILKSKLQHYIKNDDLLYLGFYLIDTHKTGLNTGSGSSQYLCNFLLSFAYHYVLSLTKVKRGKSVKLVNFALFYMDDILLVGSRKADVKKAAKMLKQFMQKDLGLTIKPTDELFLLDTVKNGVRCGRPIDMMGYVMYRDHTVIRAKTFLKARRAYIKAWRCIKSGKQLPQCLARRCMSYNGFIKHTNSKHFVKKYHIDDINVVLRKEISTYDKSKISAKTKNGVMAGYQQ